MRTKKTIFHSSKKNQNNCLILYATSFEANIDNKNAIFYLMTRKCLRNWVKMQHI